MQTNRNNVVRNGMHGQLTAEGLRWQAHGVRDSVRTMGHLARGTKDKLA